MINPATIAFLNRSQKTRVSSTASREGGGTVGIIRYRYVALGNSNRASVVLCHAKVSRASAVSNTFAESGNSKTHAVFAKMTI